MKDANFSVVWCFVLSHYCFESIRWGEMSGAQNIAEHKSSASLACNLFVFIFVFVLAFGFWLQLEHVRDSGSNAIS